MKRSLVHGFSVLLLATTAMTIALPGMAQLSNQRPATRSFPAIAENDASGLVEPVKTSDFHAPIIKASGVRNESHFIRIAVIEMAIKDLMIALPKQMDTFEAVRVLDQFGKDVPAQISIDQNRVAIAFDQPVAPGGALEVLFTGVQMRGPGGQTLLYGVTAERVGASGEIPIGFARVRTPSRD